MKIGITVQKITELAKLLPALLQGRVFCCLFLSCWIVPGLQTIHRLNCLAPLWRNSPMNYPQAVYTFNSIGGLA
jgi:hypothetical protein